MNTDKLRLAIPSIDRVWVRWEKYFQRNNLPPPADFKAEQQEIFDVLNSEIILQRVERCGNCKQTVDCKLTCSVTNKNVVKREYSCPECKEVFMIKYITDPNKISLR